MAKKKKRLSSPSASVQAVTTRSKGVGATSFKCSASSSEVKSSEAAVVIVPTSEKVTVTKSINLNETSVAGIADSAHHLSLGFPGSSPRRTDGSDRPSSEDQAMESPSVPINGAESSEIVLEVDLTTKLAPEVTKGTHFPTSAQTKPLWRDVLRVSSDASEAKEEGFVLESGDKCIKIPNEMIERNKKQWDNFIIGQFYGDAPSRGAAYAIANGIWSSRLRDISVSRLSDRAFLFRIPSAATRRRVLNQGMWHFDGETMFVAKWEPGTSPELPELTSAPVWLEMRNVPLQFYNDESLKRIASLVGKPVHCHQETLNLSNLEVAKVYTLIDPRERLPEFVCAQFESGHTQRISISSPWLPPICSLCNAVGHSSKRCPDAPITCSACNSKSHKSETCPRRNRSQGPKVNRSQDQNLKEGPKKVDRDLSKEKVEVISKGMVGTKKKQSGIILKDSSEIVVHNRRASDLEGDKRSGKRILEEDMDAEDYVSSGSEAMEDDEEGFTKYLSSRQRKRDRGNSPKKT